MLTKEIKIQKTSEDDLVSKFYFLEITFDRFVQFARERGVTE